MTRSPQPMSADGAWQMRSRLRDALAAAMKAREPDAVAALRTAIAALDNAEAIEIRAAGRPQADEYVASARAGLGSTEARRRDLSASDVQAILYAQVADRLAEAERYELYGQVKAAHRLRREADVLTQYVRDL